MPAPQVAVPSSSSKPLVGNLGGCRLGQRCSWRPSGGGHAQPRLHQGGGSPSWLFTLFPAGLDHSQLVDISGQILHWPILCFSVNRLIQSDTAGWPPNRLQPGLPLLFSWRNVCSCLRTTCARASSAGRWFATSAARADTALHPAPASGSPPPPIAAFGCDKPPSARSQYTCQPPWGLLF